MKSPDALSRDYNNRLGEILDISWKILKSRFVDGRHIITTEAPFQHYFANIISTIGEAYCTQRNDIFLVDLETKIEGLKGKSKYLDITCGFPRQNRSCAIELKFKTKRQGAQDFGRIDAFVDIEALELVCERSFDIGRFYMITDSTAYIKQSKKGVGTVFRLHDGAIIEPGVYQYPSKGREHVNVTLRDSYVLEWEKIGDWYFLQVNIEKAEA